jgi:hypothetical protein
VAIGQEDAGFGALHSLEGGLRALDFETTVELQFESVVRGGLADLPLPGAGSTETRFAMLQSFGRHDLSLARLVEGHTDAVAILAEAGRATLAATGGRLGVWAAGPVESLVASRHADGWRLDGLRRWCSGAPFLTDALVRASSEDGERLFLVSLSLLGVDPISGSWPAIGMAGSATVDVAFDAVELTDDAAVGPPDFYLSRVGFWRGAAGVAAVWLGGAEAAAAIVAGRAGRDPHRLAHLGAIQARLVSLNLLLATVARAIDANDLEPRAFERLVRILRVEIEAGATEVLERTGRATGADPLCHDLAHARRAADLPVYLRQTHAETDLAALGGLEQELAREAEAG